MHQEKVRGVVRRLGEGGMPAVGGRGERVQAQEPGGLQTLSLTLPRGRRQQLSFLQVGGTAWPEPGGGRQAEQA